MVAMNPQLQLQAFDPDVLHIQIQLQAFKLQPLWY